jgi:hypothetical protein
VKKVNFFKAAIVSSGILLSSPAYGQSNPTIEAVKNARFPFDPGITVGAALEKFKFNLPGTFDWSHEVDLKGRQTIVFRTFFDLEKINLAQQDITTRNRSIPMLKDEGLYGVTITFTLSPMPNSLLNVEVTQIAFTATNTKKSNPYVNTVTDREVLPSILAEFYDDQLRHTLMYIAIAQDKGW